jgi:hypothetical protein
MPVYKLNELNQAINGNRDLAAQVSDTGNAAKRFDATDDEILTSGIFRIRALASGLDEAARNLGAAKRQILNKGMNKAVGELAKMAAAASKKIENEIGEIYENIDAGGRVEKINRRRKEAIASTKKITVKDPIKALVHGEG